jgi:uncharacterized protein (UPF0303 family)
MTTDALPDYSIDGLERDHEVLRFSTSDQGDAFMLGSIASSIVSARGLAVAIEVAIGEHIVYTSAQGGASPDTADWLRRKAAVARLDGASSLLVKMRHEQDGQSFDDRGLDPADCAAYGGSVPLIIDNAVVGTITCSGAADVVDHEIAVTAVRTFRSLT